jgi:DNA uptake protein ComE-like DNA-binding protein
MKAAEKASSPTTSTKPATTSKPVFSGTTTPGQATPVKSGEKSAPGPLREVSSEVVDITSNTFQPSPKVQAEIEANGKSGLDVRVAIKGVTAEGRAKIRLTHTKKYETVHVGSMRLLNPWADQLGGLFINFSVKDSNIAGGASLKAGAVAGKDWLTALQNNAALLGGAGLHVAVPKELSLVNKLDGGKLILGVSNLKVEVGGFLHAVFNLALENAQSPKVDGTGDINVKGIAKGKIKFDNTQGKLAGQVSLGLELGKFSGLAEIKYNTDGTVDIGGKAAYNADRLSGEISVVATDEDSANSFAREAIASAGGKENVQAAAPPKPVPAPKADKKTRALAASGQLNFNLTQWFAGTVFVVVDSKGHVTVIGKIVPPAEIELFKQRDWDKELFKFEAKAYYGIPVVGNLNLFANISLHALASLGPAKIYAIEVLGTYSTDPSIQKNIQISGSINISAYAGLRLRAEGGAGIEILSHDLKFGVGVKADIGVKAYADARPTIGYRDPGEFYISGTLDLVAQPMLGLGGDFFIQIETPWWSPLSDDKWTWPLFSKEWPLSDPIGLSATVSNYVLGSGKAPEIELKKPEFDSSKFMTNMVDRKLPDKAGGAGEGHGTFKEDGSVPKPEVKPKKPEPKKGAPKAGKKGSKPKVSESKNPNPAATKEFEESKLIKKAADLLAALKGKTFTRADLTTELNHIKASVSGVELVTQYKGNSCSVAPKSKGKSPKPVVVNTKDGKVEDKKDGRTEQKKNEDLDKAIADAYQLQLTPHIKESEIKKRLPQIQKKYSLASIELVIDQNGDAKETLHIEAEINPRKKSRPTEAETDKAWEKSKSSPPVWGPLQKEFGTSVAISSLTKGHPRGSSASATGDLWDSLRRRKDGGTTYYVRGHLLNGELGGPGNQWRNLAPITQATNNKSAVSMLHTFENKVKDAVSGGDTVDFHVTMVYGRTDRSAQASKKNKAIREIVKAEQYVPTSVTLKSDKIGDDSKKTALVPERTVQNSIDENLDRYYISGEDREKIDINGCSREVLLQLNGVDSTIADKIIALRKERFKNREDLLKRLSNDAAFHRLVSTSGIELVF